MLAVGWAGAVVAKTAAATGAPHGAAAMATQQQALDRLLPSDLTGVPAGVDPAVWKAVVPEDNAMTADRIALGRKLYFEMALSKDGTVACATCHDVTRSFTDRRATSEGTGDQIGNRNAPTTMNAALLHLQFLDGREPTLEAQAGQPILNPVEHGLPNEKAAIAALEKIPEYEDLFKKAYGRSINYDDLERAIASFERTLIFLDAPFDRFLAGDETAISADAQAGWTLFNGKARCMSCHPLSPSNPLGTDNRMHNIGVSAHEQDFEKLAKRALEALEKDRSQRKLDELAVGTDLSELGRFMVTKSYADIGAFRTPQIRNIGITGPYMHDGSLNTLWDVVDHYNAGGEANPYLDGGMEALDLTEQEIDQVVAFLFTLTDKRFAKLNEEEMAKQRERAQENRPERDEALATRRELPFERRVMGAATGKGGEE
jgi:cytochrome c peroxidase